MDNLLAILRRDGGTTVYLNELPMDISVRVRGSVEKGADVYTGPISQILRGSNFVWTYLMTQGSFSSSR